MTLKDIVDRSKKQSGSSRGFPLIRRLTVLRSVLSYLNRFLQFPVFSTVSAKSLPAFKKNSDVVVVGYVAADDEDSKAGFEALAKSMHPEYLFGVTNDPALADSECI